jgi:hypothetical protein
MHVVLEALTKLLIHVSRDVPWHHAVVSLSRIHTFLSLGAVDVHMCPMMTHVPNV